MGKEKILEYNSKLHNLMADMMLDEDVDEVEKLWLSCRMFAAGERDVQVFRSEFGDEIVDRILALERKSAARAFAQSTGSVILRENGFEE